MLFRKVNCLFDKTMIFGPILNIKRFFYRPVKKVKHLVIQKTIKVSFDNDLLGWFDISLTDGPFSWLFHLVSDLDRRHRANSCRYWWRFWNGLFHDTWKYFKRINFVVMKIQCKFITIKALKKAHFSAGNLTSIGNVKKV